MVFVFLCLTSFSIRRSRSMHAVTNGKISLFLMAHFSYVCIFFLKIALAVWGPFVVPHNQDYLFQLYEKYHWHFNMDCPESVDCLDSIDITTILILPVREHDISFHFFVSSSISFIKALQFSEYRTFTSLFKFIPRYLILSDRIVNVLIS